jgi:hypothetical protein
MVTLSSMPIRKIRIKNSYSLYEFFNIRLMSANECGKFLESLKTISTFNRLTHYLRFYPTTGFVF